MRQSARRRQRAHEGYGDLWEEFADLWALKPAFLLAWALIQQHPYAELEEELEEADLTAHGADRDRRPHRLRDQAQDAIAHLTGLSTTDLFASVPDSGFMIGDLRRHRVGAPALGGALALAAEWQWFSGPLSRGRPAGRGALVAIDGLPTERDIS